MSLSIGCIEVPCNYVVAWTAGRVDVFSGHIEPPEKNWQVTWMTGLWESLMQPREGRDILWVNEEVVGGRAVTVGRIRERGKEMFVVAMGVAQFTMPADVPGSLKLLTEVVARYRTNNQGVKCEPALPPDPKRAF